MEENEALIKENEQSLSDVLQQPVAEELAAQPCEAAPAVEEAAETQTEVPAEPAEEAEPVPVAPVKEKKPGKGKKIMILLGALVACAAIVGTVVYLVVLKPNGIYDDAKAAFLAGNYQECERLMNKIPDHEGVSALRADMERAIENDTYTDAEAALQAGNFQECERLMNKIPDHEKVPALRIELDIAIAQDYIASGELSLAESILVKITGNDKAKTLKEDIQYLKAVEEVNKGNIEDAKLLLDKIPNHADPELLYEKIKYREAVAAVEIGDYETAYEKFTELGDYEDSAKQKEIVYYEALAFKSLFVIQPDLKNPASLRVTEVGFYKDSSTEGELDCVHEITATNTYGGSVGGYVFEVGLYDGDEDDADMIDHSTYVDPEDYYEYLESSLVDLIRDQEPLDVTVDVARMNRLLEGKVSFKIDLPFQSSAVVES